MKFLRFSFDPVLRDLHQRNRTRSFEVWVCADKSNKECSDIFKVKGVTIEI